MADNQTDMAQVVQANELQDREVVVKRGINKLGLGALSFGHMVVDMQTSALAVLIPLLYVSFRLDYASAALIVTMNSLTSSIIQPIFGMISDKKSLRWLLPAGCLIASIGMALVIFMPSYGLVVLMVILSGLGVAAYHPEATRNANYVSGERKAAGFSFFYIGGNVGYAYSPILTTALIGLFGRDGALATLIPGILGFALLWYLLPLYARYAPQKHQSNAVQTTIRNEQVISKGRTIWAMILLIAIICTRSMIQVGLVTFIPLYFASLPGHDKAYTAFLLSIFVFAGTVGTLIGGPLADRWNRKAFMIGSLTLVTPSLLLFLYSSGWLQIAAIALAGAALIVALSVPVVMAQELLPNNVGLASGLTLGFGFGAGGLGTAIVGLLADHFGIIFAMFTLAILPMLGVFLSVLLPTSKKVLAHE